MRYLRALPPPPPPLPNGPLPLGITEQSNLPIIASSKETAARYAWPCLWKQSLGFKYTLNEMLSGVILHACTVEVEIFYCAADTCGEDIQSIVVKRDYAQLRWTSPKHRRGRISVDNRIPKPLGHMAPSSPSPSSRVSSNIDLRQLELPGRGREESTHILVITQRSGKHCQMK